MQEESNKNPIVTSFSHAYTVAEKVFCCKCFDCCKDVTVMTSNMRKQTLQRMIRNYVIDQHEVILYDPTKLLILIYLCQDIQIPKKHFSKCRINPNLGTNTYRTDLQFYIPQLCNYIVFHSNLNQSYLLDGLEKGSRLSFYFSHLYYFYMISLQKIINKNQIQILKKVSEYMDNFTEEMCKFYQGQNLSSIELYGNFKTNVYPTQPDIGLFIKTYGTKEQDSILNQRILLPSDLTFPKYTSIFSDDIEMFSFKSTINFFDDLFAISQQLGTVDNKKAFLKKSLREMNERLPACVYIPFSKNFIRLSNVLNIVASECRIFSTKQRAPYYICLEVFSPEEALGEPEQQKFWDKVEAPFTLEQTFRSENILNRQRRTSLEYNEHRLTNVNIGKIQKTNFRRQSPIHDPYSQSIRTQIMSQRQSKLLNNKLLQFNNQMVTQPRLIQQKRTIQLKSILQTSPKIKKNINDIFGESVAEFKDRIKGKSIFGHLGSWDLVHIIVKTNDDLKQQQFALQLIQQFEYIFKIQKLPLLLTPYQVLSMGPDRGIIEMVKDSITFDALKKKLKTQFPKPLTLKNFFEINFENNLTQTKQIFLKSLAAYSLVMYFLQAKDRHNGNILLHKSGKIFHIDFGFFLSNMPGKGVELEKVCPFKLMSEHIDVLDGPDSYYFKKFREYFFLGFKAARKHQNKIMILVKMMYSSGGMSMPCFQKGENAILEMQQRFNPTHVGNDAQLNLNCQKLIDESLDNWAARWYDRWQYWAQGIFY